MGRFNHGIAGAAQTVAPLLVSHQKKYIGLSLMGGSLKAEGFGDGRRRRD
jgi:hypothetical protein